MHIALVRKCCSLKKAGAERYCVNLGRNLQRLGQQVTIVGETIDEELRAEFDFVPVPVTQTTSWAKNRSFAENVKQAVAGRRFDLVHSLSRTPCADTFRLTDPLQAHWFQLCYKHPAWRWLQRLNPRHRTLFALEREIYGKAGTVRRIITQSRLDARLIHDYYGVPADRIRQVYNGVDTKVFHPGVRAAGDEVRKEIGVPADAPLLVFASMDFRRKGLDALLAALARVQRKDARLLVLGDGPRAAYGRKAEQMGIGERVIFTGRRQAIERYYGAGDLFVLPTIYEPFPNVNLEAMACGTPVLTTATAGGADIIEEGRNGYVVPQPNDIEGIVAGIDRHLALDTAARQMMADACWQTARAMTLEKNARETLSIFEEVLLEKSRV